MEIFLKGVAAGLAVAAPVGPIGLICIRASLTNGLPAGLVSGFGVALADAFYGMLAALGLVSSGLLMRYSSEMQIVGGMLILLLGVVSMRKFYVASAPPNGPVKLNSGEQKKFFTAFASTFALTLANPMTILTFLGLIAGLGAAATSDANAPYRLVVGVFCGSMLWWVFLAVSLSFMGRTLNHSLLRWLDAISGIMLMLWGLWIIASP